MDAPLALKKSVLLELEDTWSTAWTSTLQRGSSSAADFDLSFLYSHYLVERHREALLWSFFFARSDIDGDGKYSEKELESLKRELGIENDSIAKDRQVRQPERTTTHMNSQIIQDNLQNIGSSLLRSTEVSFTSFDGFSPAPMTRPYSRNISYNEKENQDACIMPAVCFEPFFGSGKDLSVQEVYLRFAHQLWMCGDCCE